MNNVKFQHWRKHVRGFYHAIHSTRGIEQPDGEIYESEVITECRKKVPYGSADFQAQEVMMGIDTDGNVISENAAILTGHLCCHCRKKGKE